jgi:hypothetical protein
MGGMVVIWLAFFASAAVGLAVAWWVARRAKDRIDGGSRSDRCLLISDLDVPSTVAWRLAALTPDPIFLKQDGHGVRVQLENRPVMSPHFLTDQGAAAAMHQITLAVSERFGPRWACLITARADGKVTVRRLA